MCFFYVLPTQKSASVSKQQQNLQITLGFKMISLLFYGGQSISYKPIYASKLKVSFTTFTLYFVPDRQTDVWLLRNRDPRCPN